MMPSFISSNWNIIPIKLLLIFYFANLLCFSLADCQFVMISNEIVENNVLWNGIVERWNDFTCDFQVYKEVSCTLIYWIVALRYLFGIGKKNSVISTKKKRILHSGMIFMSEMETIVTLN